MNKINLQCTACKSYSVEKFYINLPFFRHIDFVTISDNNYLYKCHQCQTFTNINIKQNQKTIFSTRKYALSNQGQQLMKINNSSKNISRSYVQAKFICDNIIFKNKPRILDIGCYDGQLLNNINIFIKKGEFWGLDINNYLKKFFPKKNNFYFISKDLKNINHKFDLIIFSYSLSYIPDLPKLMNKIKDLLKKNGKLFIQLPDISKKPIYSLMGDQLYIFSKTSINNVLKNYGFRIIKIKMKHFKQEIVIVAEKNAGKVFQTFKYDSSVERSFEILKNMKKSLNNISFKKLSVLGTTVHAAYVDEILKNKLISFVDENPAFIGKVFRKKHVVHPSNLLKDSKTILPLGSQGKKLMNRFKKLYKGSFILI